MAGAIVGPFVGVGRSASLHFRTFFRGSRLWSGPLLLLISVGFTILAVTQGKRMSFYEETIAPNTLFGGLALLIPLLYSGGAWAEEVDRRTITYLLLRPTPRYSLYLGKVLCSSLIIAGLFLGAELICFGAISLGYPPEIIAFRLPDLLHHAEALFASALAYGALFSFIGVILPRFSLLVSIAYGAMAEVLLPELPVSFRYITIQHNVRAIAGLVLTPERAQAGLILLGYVILFGGLGALIAARRDYTFSD